MSVISLDSCIQFGSVTFPLKTFHSLYIKKKKKKERFEVLLRLGNASTEPLCCYFTKSEKFASEFLKECTQKHNDYLSQIKPTNGGSCSSNKTN